MDTAILIIISITLLFTVGLFLLHCFLGLPERIKPRIKVYFEGGSTVARYEAKEEIVVPFFVTNIGRGFLRPEARRVNVCVNTPTTLPIKKLVYLDYSIDGPPMIAPKGGRFEGMHFLAIHDAHSIFYGEEMPVNVHIGMPEQKTRYNLEVDVSSAQGSLGIHTLEIIKENLDVQATNLSDRNYYKGRLKGR